MTLFTVATSFIIMLSSGRSLATADETFTDRAQILDGITTHDALWLAATDFLESQRDELCSLQQDLAAAKKEPTISSLDNYSYNPIISNRVGSLFDKVSPYSLAFAVSGNDASITTPYGTHMPNGGFVALLCQHDESARTRSQLPIFSSSS
jgi:hypothetical protein